jgi:hypothetical protein
MRALALIAFFALQLSVFICGFDIHVHAMDADIGHVAEHLHDKNENHEQDSTDHGCHVHASHSFTALEVEQYEKSPLVSNVHQYALTGVSLKNLSFLIEHPPKFQHS